ncbi:NAD(+) synthase [Enterovirga rhinocerotis]|uniref:Glutamine-dependent NAD(+) synthetase n=1 Tax=Enterovirga rhinocerotis TaxID=1339210 RepID=A0A4R7BVM2_9HYPH|nr:NAD(+) synthase [Enterovirga rhinocerotis]TDR89884.1 NAD+ synthase (glutamine-hydrolysing) [Enterovirga rhinocerotis]
MVAPADFDFRSLYRHGFARAAACTIRSAVADPAANGAAVLEAARLCHDRVVAVAVFPELCLSGYAIEDLLHQDVLLDGVERAIAVLVEASADLMPVLVVGAPLRHGSRLYNAACVIHRGRLLGVVPKTYLPTYREFYEARHFASASGAPREDIRIGALASPFGTDLLFSATDLPGLVLGIEICEDMWIPVPPAAGLALAGATVLANLSGSPITIGRARSRELLCRSASMRYNGAYLYAAGGAGESTTDLGWDGQTTIHEAGSLLAEGPRFADGAVITVADLDLDLIRLERAAMGTFDDNRRVVEGADPGRDALRTIAFRLDPPRGDVGFERVLERFPFVPADDALLRQDCYEGYNIQVAGLEQRLRATGTKRVVIGVSGGLDSTHALIVTAAAFDRLGLKRTDILAYTMPGFGTTDETKTNAIRLMSALGVTQSILDIRPTATLMLETIDHPAGRGEPVYDATYENVQAGLRTDYLFRLANQHGGIVIGTGDLSELALGWCTYGVGDQMSHYNVNAGVPKTLIQHLIRWVAASGEFEKEAGEVLIDILGTEISPELIPGGTQSTEATIGPYELQDFNLFYTLRYGMRPSKIVFLAERAWGDPATGAWPPAFPEAGRRAYDRATIRRWMAIFLKRFFGFAQFKRSALPNGPKVVAGGSLSPRGDWRAPSDSSAGPWLAELERNVPDA